MDSTFTLQHDNLIPFYLVEDRMKENFSTISKFISQQQSYNRRNDGDIDGIRKGSK